MNSNPPIITHVASGETMSPMAIRPGAITIRAGARGARLIRGATTVATQDRSGILAATVAAGDYTLVIVHGPGNEQRVPLRVLASTAVTPVDPIKPAARRAILGAIPGGRRPVGWTPAETAVMARRVGVTVIRDYFTLRLNPNADQAKEQRDKAAAIKALLDQGLSVVVTVTCPLRGSLEHGWPHQDWAGLARAIEQLIDPRAIIQLINEAGHRFIGTDSLDADKDGNRTEQIELTYWPGADWRSANVAAVAIAREIKKLNPKRLIGSPSCTTRPAAWIVDFGNHLINIGATGLFDFIDHHYYTSSVRYLRDSLIALNRAAIHLGAKVMVSEFSIGNAALSEGKPSAGNQPMKVFTDVIELMVRKTDLCCFWFLNPSDTPHYAGQTALLNRDGSVGPLGLEWLRVMSSAPDPTVSPDEQIVFNSVRHLRRSLGGGELTLDAELCAAARAQAQAAAAQLRTLPWATIEADAQRADAHGGVVHQAMTIDVPQLATVRPRLAGPGVGLLTDRPQLVEAVNALASSPAHSSQIADRLVDRVGVGCASWVVSGTTIVVARAFFGRSTP
jgi:hypothetical protein